MCIVNVLRSPIFNINVLFSSNFTPNALCSNFTSCFQCCADKWRKTQYSSLNVLIYETCEWHSDLMLLALFQYIVYGFYLQKLAEITGSRAYERFTGPQIKKVYQTKKAVYNNTEVSNTTVCGNLNSICCYCSWKFASRKQVSKTHAKRNRYPEFDLCSRQLWPQCCLPHVAG
jgi:hypothetical protein